MDRRSLWVCRQIAGASGLSGQPYPRKKWAFFHDRQNHLRDAAGGTVRLPQGPAHHPTIITEPDGRRQCRPCSRSHPLPASSRWSLPAVVTPHLGNVPSPKAAHVIAGPTGQVRGARRHAVLCKQRRYQPVNFVAGQNHFPQYQVGAQGLRRMHQSSAGAHSRRRARSYPCPFPALRRSLCPNRCRPLGSADT